MAMQITSPVVLQLVSGILARVISSLTDQAKCYGLQLIRSGLSMEELMEALIASTRTCLHKCILCTVPVAK